MESMGEDRRWGGLGEYGQTDRQTRPDLHHGYLGVHWKNWKRQPAAEDSQRANGVSLHLNSGSLHLNRELQAWALGPTQLMCKYLFVVAAQHGEVERDLVMLEDEE